MGIDVTKNNIVLFIDWAPTENKSEISSGNQIRRYYALRELKRQADRVILFRDKSKKINWLNILCALDKTPILWIEYGCGGVAHLFTIILSLIRIKKLVVNVHDLHMQQNYFNEKPSILKKLRLNIVERILLSRADVIIFAWPKLLDYFVPRENQKIIIMPPGIGEDEVTLINSLPNGGKKIAVYFGSMRRKGIMTLVIETFSEMKDWELCLIGPMEGENIIESNNVKYLGSMNHEKTLETLCNANIILIPLPNNEYTNKLIPIKCGYALRSCKPVIASKLDGISEFISKIGLEQNIIYVNNWKIEELREAISIAENIHIDAENTIEILKTLSWEPRFEKVVEKALKNTENPGQIESI